MCPVLYIACLPDRLSRAAGHPARRILLIDTTPVTPPGRTVEFFVERLQQRLDIRIGHAPAGSSCGALNSADPPFKRSAHLVRKDAVSIHRTLLISMKRGAMIEP